jgi:hypothetical protein
VAGVRDEGHDLRPQVLRAHLRPHFGPVKGGLHFQLKKGAQLFFYLKKNFFSIKKPEHSFFSTKKLFSAAGCNLASIWNLYHHLPPLSLEHQSLKSKPMYR